MRAVSPVVRDDKGRIVRPDWSKPPTVHYQDSPAVPVKKNWSGLPDWNQPRNEQGQFITKSDAELRQQWEKEGGYAQNVARVQAVEAKILSLSENPEALQSHIATLPEAIQLKAADVMRLPTGYGPDGGAIKLEIFLDSLSPSEWQTFEGWWRGLSRGNQDCILAAISRP